MLVMSTIDRGPVGPVSPFLLSAAAEMDAAIEEGRAMDVKAISKHDARVLIHPWYSSGSTLSQRPQCLHRNKAIDASSHALLPQHRCSLPPRFRLGGKIKAMGKPVLSPSTPNQHQLVPPVHP